MDSIYEVIHRINESQNKIAAIRADHNLKSGQSLLGHLDQCDCNATEEKAPVALAQ